MARPAARGAVDALGHARALLEQDAEPAPVAVLAHDRLDRGAGERPERHRGVVAVLGGGEHEQRAARDGDALELAGHLRGRVVESSTTSRVGRRIARACSITRRAASGEPAPDA